MSTEYVHQLLHQERVAGLHAEAARERLARQAKAAGGRGRSGRGRAQRVRFARFTARRRNPAV